MGYKILIAEDDLKVQNNLKNLILAINGENKVLATDQAEISEEWVKEYDFDMFYIDIQLAGKENGWDLIKKIAHTHPGYPIIVVSGAVDQSEIISAFNNQLIFMIINKPYTAEDIFSSFNKAVDALKYIPSQSISFKADGIRKRYKETDIYYVKRHQTVQQKAIVRAYDALNKCIIETEVSLRGTITKITSMFRREKTLIRCHQSYLVNPRHIVEYDYAEEQLVLTDGTHIPVGAKFFKEISPFV